MKSAVSKLQPVALWNHFADLNAVPRASKKEERVIEFARQFGEKCGLPTAVDAVGNVRIRKPATPGMEDRATVVLQSHLDMVHQKNANVQFDFEREGIRMMVDGDWVHAEGTTLGADNGIGVAAIMALLESNDIPHPPLEALFTIDEETGMTGAKGLQPGWLNGTILLNLDTEDDTELTIGCAGGVDVSLEGACPMEKTPAAHTSMRIAVRGLTGGHSGMDIHLGRGNANKLMNRLLWHGATRFGLRVASIDGGGLRNAIPRESTATVALPSGSVKEFSDWLESEVDSIRSEYQTTDPQLAIEASNCDSPAEVIGATVQKTLLAAIYACPNGIHRMSPEVPGLVQTSNNIARVSVAEGKLLIGCLTRSSVNSERDDLASAISAIFGLLDGKVTASGSYTGWKPVPDSDIVKLMSGLHEEMYGEPAHVSACHAGLECGIIGRNYPSMQMISFGPNIRGAHSPDEKVQISSVQKFWKFLVETLSRIPVASHEPELAAR
jgi:dipeptidase D